MAKVKADPKKRPALAKAVEALQARLTQLELLCSDLERERNEARQLAEALDLAGRKMLAERNAAVQQAAEAQTEMLRLAEQEQSHKRRMVQAEKVAKRLWKALAYLDSETKTPAETRRAVDEARAFRTIHVRQGEHGILELVAE